MQLLATPYAPDSAQFTRNSLATARAISHLLTRGGCHGSLNCVTLAIICGKCFVCAKRSSPSHSLDTRSAHRLAWKSLSVGRVCLYKYNFILTDRQHARQMHDACTDCTPGRTGFAVQGGRVCHLSSHCLSSTHKCVLLCLPDVIAFLRRSLRLLCMIWL